VADPYLAYAKLLTFATAKPYVPLGVHPKAVVDESARLGRDVSIHALAYVGPNAVIGDSVVLHPGVYVGPGAVVGDDSVLHPNVVVYHGCLIGKRCLIHAGTIIGADGYGFVPQGERHFKIPQVGIVQIDDDVELGAANTIDRAATGRTWIKSGVKTDNQVHVAHNCVIGENSLLVAQVGISGSAQLGRNVVLGGQVGLAGHITLGDRVMVGAQSGVASLSASCPSCLIGSRRWRRRPFRDGKSNNRSDSWGSACSTWKKSWRYSRTAFPFCWWTGCWSLTRARASRRSRT
jgi:UDP-3-O-[3-hydroxymyristoyl] glucosamine N-acyltransferase